MYTSLFATASILLPLTLASPLNLAPRTSGPSAPFGMVAIHSGIASIQYQSINAANQGFYIDEPTKTSCPKEVVKQCPPGNVTALIVDNKSGRASLDTEVPGGQAIYVAPSGALAFTPAHSSGGANEGALTGFSYKNNTVDGTLGRFSFKGRGSTGFLACPVNDKPGQPGPWQVFASVKGLKDSAVPNGKVSECVGIDVLGATYEGGVAAWQYE